MLEIWDFLVTHGNSVAAGLLAAHGLAVAIVNLTPTPADDAIVGKLYKPIEWLAGIFTKLAKDKNASGK